MSKQVHGVNRIVQAFGYSRKGLLAASLLLIVVVELLLTVLHRLVDLGPEGGDGGRRILISGTPETIAATKTSHTGRFLKPLLSRGI